VLMVSSAMLFFSKSLISSPGAGYPIMSPCGPKPESATTRWSFEVKTKDPKLFRKYWPSKYSGNLSWNGVHASSGVSGNKILGSNVMLPSVSPVMWTSPIWSVL